MVEVYVELIYFDTIIKTVSANINPECETVMTSDSPFFVEGIDRSANIIITCDHASNRVPPCVNNGCLGLPADDMARHIAYDIGAKGMSLALGALLDAPVIGSNFSRLVIDPNRGADDPTVLMRLYDGTLIPANRHADAAEKQRRLDAFHTPYDQALGALIATKDAPVLIAIHSFTPQLRGRDLRPWQVGILFADDTRISDPLISSLRGNLDWTVGVNQPYKGSLAGDTMDRHAIKPGLKHGLIEVRNDLIETPEAQQNWATHLAPHITHAITAAQGS